MTSLFFIYLPIAHSICEQAQTAMLPLSLPCYMLKKQARRADNEHIPAKTPTQGGGQPDRGGGAKRGKGEGTA